MTPKERVTARLAGNAVDKIPNFNVLMLFAAKYIGRYMHEFCTDYRVLVEANIRTCADFGVDLLATYSDAYRETADYGANIRFPHDSLPVCEHFIKTLEDVKKLRPFRMEDSKRMHDRMRAVELYKKECGDHWPVMGWIEGCAAESSDLMGLTELIYAFYDEPGMVRDIMDICCETALNCIGPQVEAGADIIGVGDAVASVLGPNVYREWILPYEQKLFAEVKRCGAIGRLHICGNILPILNDLRTCGAEIIDVDWMVDFETARRTLEGAAIVCGNFDPVGVVLNGTPKTITEAVDRCCIAGGESCIIMAGCEIPRDTPHSNLRAVAEALEKRK